VDEIHHRSTTTKRIATAPQAGAVVMATYIIARVVFSPSTAWVVSVVTPWAGVHRDGVAVGDVLADIVAREGAQFVVVQTAREKPVVVRVDRGDTPAVAVTHRVLLCARVAGVAQRDRGVVVAGYDQIADGGEIVLPLPSSCLIHFVIVVSVTPDRHRSKQMVDIPRDVRCSRA
jgi:hypothetical protein